MIDAISVLAVEQCLVGKLPSLFQAELILDLKNDEITRLAQESNGAAMKRVQCNDKLAVLEAGKEDLNRLDSHRSLRLGSLLLPYQLEYSQADDKLTHPVANKTIGENNVVIKSMDLSAMESGSAVTRSDIESLKRADSFDSLQAIQKPVENDSNLGTPTNGSSLKAEPEADLSWHGLFPKKEKKKKKTTSSLWDEE